tara:strand:+ start:1922 stop:2338 length:417 start_codon:yes stop_codon:yes gene_type:complete
MTNFTKEQLRTLRAEMQSLLLAHPFEETIDIPIDKISVDSCTYSGGEATFKVKVLLDGAETKEEKDLKKMAILARLDTSKVHEYTDHRSVRYRMQLVGYKTKARKMPWIVKDLLSMSGNEYKLTDAQARQWFEYEVQS